MAKKCTVMKNTRCGALRASIEKSLFMLSMQISDVPVASDAVIAYAPSYPLGMAGDHLLKKEKPYPKKDLFLKKLFRDSFISFRLH